MTQDRPTGQSTQALGAGLTFAATMAVFAYGGMWLDGKWNTSPLMLLIGVGLALVGGTIHLLATLAPSALPFRRRPRSDDPKQPPPTP